MLLRQGRWCGRGLTKRGLPHHVVTGLQSRGAASADGHHHTAPDNGPLASWRGGSRCPTRPAAATAGYCWRHQPAR